MTTHEKEDGQRDEAPELVSIVLMTLACPDVTIQAEDRKNPWVQVAMDFQMLGAQSSWADIQGVFRGQEYGRVAEILGVAAAAGEQLGLAYTCHLDAARWEANSPDDPAESSKHLVSARAFAEMTGYYALGAAHALVNTTSRLLAIDEACSMTLEHSPFDLRRGAWASFNSSTVKKLEKALDGQPLPKVAELVAQLRELVDDPRWRALVGRRDTGYHRWRPQSVPGGAATVNPWKEHAPGQYVYTVSARSQHVPPEARPLVEEAGAGLDALAESMDRWLAVLPAAFGELKVPVFKLPEETQ